MKRGNRSLWKSVISSPLSLVAAVVVVVLLGRASWHMLQKAQVSSERLTRASDELGRLEARKVDLAAQIASLSTDDGVESRLREKYPAVREGESVAVIVDEPVATTTTGQTGTTASTSWWRKMLRVVGL